MTKPEDKLRLIQKYIKERKGVTVPMLLPRTVDEQFAMNHMFTYAKNYYNNKNQ